MTTFLTHPHGHKIAYEKCEGHGPCVVFLSGFKSDMTGSKAAFLHGWCKREGRAFLRLDYSGHGQSGGDFMQGTIGGWLSDARHVLEAALPEGDFILVGSSMGAWLALLLAKEYSARVRGFVGIASAPDFTELLVWEQFSDVQKETLEQKGVVYLPSCYGEEPYPMTRTLLHEARAHMLMGSPIVLPCPVRLLHGMSDDDVPYTLPIALAENITAEDVNLTLIKHGDHRLSKPENLELLRQKVEELASYC